MVAIHVVLLYVYEIQLYRHILLTCRAVDMWYIRLCGASPTFFMKTKSRASKKRQTGGMLRILRSIPVAAVIKKFTVDKRGGTMGALSVQEEYP